MGQCPFSLIILANTSLEKRIQKEKRIQQKEKKNINLPLHPYF
jgi:hypothetical protein